MSRLNPELKKIIRWARQAPAPEAPVMPIGFESRVLRACQSGSSIDDEFSVWQGAVWKSAWAAATVLLVGLTVLAAQRLGNKSAYDFSPAYEVVSTELIP